MMTTNDDNKYLLFSAIDLRQHIIMYTSTLLRSFLSRVSILLLTRDIDIVLLSVCPSVRDTLVLYENGLTYRHSFFHHTVAQSFQFYEH